MLSLFFGFINENQAYINEKINISTKFRIYQRKSIFIGQIEKVPGIS